MAKTLRPYEYDYDTSYNGRTEVIKGYLDKKFAGIDVDTEGIKDTIEHTIDKSLGNIDCKFYSVHNHIEKAKDQIINSQGGSPGCCCELATKADIDNAVCRINSHVDEKFDEVDFIKQFSDLNEQVRKLQQ